jgi:DNA end-binding protein Ku
MRAIWTGAISFGLVSIPVKLYSATEQKDVRLKLLHRKDGAPIAEKRFCTEENVEVGWDDLVRGYEISKGEFVILEPTEIEAVEPESATNIEIGDFVELEEIDPIYFEKSYFLEPTEAGIKPFRLFRSALSETRRVAVARVTIRNKERLATIRGYEDTLVLETMYWPDEVRSTSALELPADGSAPARELTMARSLIESLSDKFDPSEYEDRYRIALEELIEQKSRGETRNAKRRRPEPKVIDLMEALEASLRSAKEGKGGADTAKRSEKKSATRRPTAKKDDGRAAKKDDKPAAKEKAPAKRRARRAA